MNIAIVGFGDQGRSAYDYWHSAGNNLTICDQDPDLQAPQDVEKRLGPGYLQNLNVFDLIVRSPSIHPRQLVEANSPEILAKVTSVTNEFFRVCPSKRVIGVTGTKGKGTTSALITQMLEASGLRVHLGGNIGTPPLDLLKNNIQPEDWVVLELANFQLIDLAYSPKIAVCVMVAPEHLDWHSDLSEYLNSKKQMFARQTSADTAIYFARNDMSKDIASVGRGRKIPYFHAPGAEVIANHIYIGHQIICETSELSLLGEHNWENACAALTAVWQITHDIEAIHGVLRNFSGLPHRLEFVRELRGVSYYDDSFATTPEASIVAIMAFLSPKILIVGGSDKGSNFDQLAQAVLHQNVRQVITIGLMGPLIASKLHDAGYTAVTPGMGNMPGIVAQAQAAARPGDVVLLSTGCASFDMFKNYKDRGHQFQTAVHTLE